MAFVVIMHLSPEHESILAEVLQRSTTMPVRQVRDRIKVEANCVYVIPPAKHLSMNDGHLHLSDLARARPGKHVAVDLFFRTLADSHGAHCAAIVLSGADGDGAIGIKRVKERGGLTVAQDPGRPSTTPCRALHHRHRHGGLGAARRGDPRPAAAPTGAPSRGCACPPKHEDRSLPTRASRPDRPKRGGGKTAMDEAALVTTSWAFLRARTGRDFSYYKRATILRRVARRMQVNEHRGYMPPTSASCARIRARRGRCCRTCSSASPTSSATAMRSAALETMIPDPLPRQGTERHRARLERRVRHGRGSVFGGHAALRACRHARPATENPGVRHRPGRERHRPGPRRRRTPRRSPPT